MKVELKSQEIGKNCPVCGSQKTERARTCRKCYEEIGADATQAVNAVVDAIALAMEGHQAALNSSGPVQRNQVWDQPVLAQVEITADAELRTPKNGVQPYWESKMPVEGGFVSLFVFGAKDAQPGDVVTALVELKTKVVKNRQEKEVTVHYLRAQVVEGVSSNVELVASNVEYAGVRIDRLFPNTEVKEERRNFLVGFTAIRTGEETSREVNTRDAKAILAELEGSK